MSETTSHPWGRRDDEPEQAFVGFLFYRNIGPGRSLNKAYRRYVVETGLATKGNAETAQTPGQWGQFSTQYEWVHRAHEWDIWRLQTYGSRVAVLYTHNLERALEKHAEALDEFKIGDEEWEMILKTFDALGDQLEMVREGVKRKKAADDVPGSEGRGPADPPVRVGGEIIGPE